MTHSRQNVNSRRHCCHAATVIAACVGVLVALTPGQLCAVDRTYLVPSGDWDTDANWTGSVEPTSSDNAHVNDGYTVTVTLPGEIAAEVRVGYGAGKTGHLVIASGDLTTTNDTSNWDGTIYAGHTGLGRVTQSNGAVFAKCLSVGRSGEPGCLYTLVDGTIHLTNANVNRPAFEIGDSGSGTFRQIGGTITVENGAGGTASKSVWIGSQSTGNGRCEIHGGHAHFKSDNTFIGYVNATGHLYQAGGDTDLRALRIGQYGGYGTDHAIFTLNGGNVTSSEIRVGWRGEGKIIQSGGHNRVTAVMELSGTDGVASGRGVYELAGGTLDAVNQFIGPQANETIACTGVVSQTAGTNIAGVLEIGYRNYGIGSYTISDGRLQAAARINVGGADPSSDGTFTVIGPAPSIWTSTYTQTGEGTFHAHINSNGISAVSVSGTATVSGALDLSSTLFFPDASDTVTLLTAGTLSGTFSATNFPSEGKAGNIVAATVDYSGNMVRLTNIETIPYRGSVVVVR